MKFAKIQSTNYDYCSYLTSISALPFCRPLAFRWRLVLLWKQRRLWRSRLDRHLPLHAPHFTSSCMHSLYHLILHHVTTPHITCQLISQHLMSIMSPYLSYLAHVTSLCVTSLHFVTSHIPHISSHIVSHLMLSPSISKPLSLPHTSCCILISHTTLYVCTLVHMYVCVCPCLSMYTLSIAVLVWGFEVVSSAMHFDLLHDPYAGTMLASYEARTMHAFHMGRYEIAIFWVSSEHTGRSPHVSAHSPQEGHSSSALSVLPSVQNLIHCQALPLIGSYKPYQALSSRSSNTVTEFKSHSLI